MAKAKTGARKYRFVTYCEERGPKGDLVGIKAGTIRTMTAAEAQAYAGVIEQVTKEPDVDDDAGATGGDDGGDPGAGKAGGEPGAGGTGGEGGAGDEGAQQ